jgi:hypothetical protein
MVILSHVKQTPKPSIVTPPHLRDPVTVDLDGFITSLELSGDEAAAACYTVTLTQAGLRSRRGLRCQLIWTGVPGSRLLPIVCTSQSIVSFGQAHASMAVGGAERVLEACSSAAVNRDRSVTAVELPQRIAVRGEVEDPGSRRDPRDLWRLDPHLCVGDTSAVSPRLCLTLFPGHSRPVSLHRHRDCERPHQHGRGRRNGQE